MPFDVAATFGEDYLYFYEESTDDGHSDDDTAQILHLLDLPAGSSILDAPCGTGRLARRLTASGMAVTGVDISAGFIDRARAEPVPTGAGGSLEYLAGDLRALPTEGPFDAVVCWYTSFGYFDDPDCAQVLSEFRRVLRPGGVVLIETMHHDGAVRHFTAAPDAVILTRGDDTQVDVSRFDPMTGRLETERTIHRDGQVRRSTHAIRLPTPPEWVTWLESAGFCDVRITSGDGGQLELDSWVMVVQASAASEKPLAVR
jgi:SAM-dependent methyltransferase